MESSTPNPDWTELSAQSRLMGLMRVNNVNVTKKIRQRPKTKPRGARVWGRFPLELPWSGKGAEKCMIHRKVVV